MLPFHWSSGVFLFDSATGSYLLLLLDLQSSKMTEELECTEKIPKDAPNKKPSKGVEQIQALSASMSNWTRAWIFASIFLLAYAYRVDSLVRRTVSVLKQSDKPCLIKMMLV